MPQIGTRVRDATRAAPAVFFERARIVPVARILDRKFAVPGEDLPVSGVARRDHAIEHVDATAHRRQDVARHADSHQVARTFGGERWANLCERAVHLGNWLTDTKTA